jgi:uncharacterized repeat protein (TIGR01451 family)
MGLVTAFVVALVVTPVDAAPGDCPAQTLALTGNLLSTPGVPFTRPSGVAVDGSGDIYVADDSGAAVYRLDPTGDPTLVIRSPEVEPTNGGPAPPDPAFVSPSGVAVDGAGNIYVADDGSDAVYRFDPARNQTLVIRNPEVDPTNGGPAPPDPAFVSPSGVAVDGAGNIYVADLDSAAVYRFDPDGNQTLVIRNPQVEGNGGSPAPPDPAFVGPSGVAVDGSGDIYVADDGNGTAYRFDPDGNQTLAIAIPSAEGTVAVAPAGVAVDGSGNIYVSDVASSAVYQFDAAGDETFTISGTQPATGASAAPPDPAFVAPWDVAVDGSGGVYVADGGSDTVYRFVVDEVDLALTTAWSGPTLPVGDTAALTLSVSNAGPCDATDVELSAPLPAGLELVSAAAPAGTSYDDGTWAIGTLANDDVPLTLTLTVRGTEAGVRTVAAAVATASTNVGDEAAEAAITVTSGSDGSAPVAPPATPVVGVPDYAG